MIPQVLLAVGCWLMRLARQTLQPIKINLS